MSRSNKFPDIREFRTRLRTMGFSTGADRRSSASSHANVSDEPERVERPVSATGFWSVIGLVSVSVLAWLAVDMGGPGRMVAAFVTSGNSSSQLAELRQDIRALATERRQLAELRREDADYDEETEALRRRVAMLEEMLTSQSAATGLAQVSGLGAPSMTGSLPAPSRAIDMRMQTSGGLLKSDLPAKTYDRAPTAPAVGGSAVSSALDLGAVRADEAVRSRLQPDTQLGLDLGAYESIDVLRRRWQLIQARNPDTLRGLTPRRITEFGSDGRVAHRLVAAPLIDAMDVAMRCATLKARSVPCRQTIGAGEPL